MSYWYFANLFQVGDFSYIKTYTNQVLMGLGDGKLYTAGLCFFILPYLTKFEPKLKRYNFIIYGLYCLLFIYALFSLRRTVLILVFLSALITFRKDLQKSLRISFIIITFLISIFPFIQDQLESRIDLRRDRITTSINTEVRWSEPSILIDEFNQEGISMVIFGKELFNSSGNYANGIYRDRMLHIDYIHILFSSGILGMILYLLIFLQLFKKYYFLSKKYNGLNKIELDLIFKFLFFASFLISFSGQMYEITFRSIIFLYLGGVMGIYSNFIENVKSR